MRNVNKSRSTTPPMQNQRFTTMKQCRDLNSFITNEKPNTCRLVKHQNSFVADGLTRIKDSWMVLQHHWQTSHTRARRKKERVILQQQSNYSQPSLSKPKFNLKTDWKKNHMRGNKEKSLGTTDLKQWRGEKEPFNCDSTSSWTIQNCHTAVQQHHSALLYLR